MKNSQKSLTSLIIIVGLVLIGGGVCIYLNKEIIKSKNSFNNQKDGIATTNDNPSFSAESPIIVPTGTPIMNQQIEQDSLSLKSIANIVASMANFKLLAEAVYDSNSGSYLSLCSGGSINTTANNNFPIIIKSILTAQGASDQLNAGIICVATKNKYALEIAFKKYISPSSAYLSGKHSYCVDSSGASGDDTKYKIDQANFSCKAQ